MSETQLQIIGLFIFVFLVAIGFILALSDKMHTKDRDIPYWEDRIQNEERRLEGLDIQMNKEKSSNKVVKFFRVMWRAMNLESLKAEKKDIQDNIARYKRNIEELKDPNFGHFG